MTTAKLALVTGATGYIGGNLVARLRRDGWHVRALVRNPQALAAAADLSVVTGDLTDPASLSGIADDVNVVFHAAALLGKWGTPPSELQRVNVDGTDHLLAACAGKDLRFIHLSAGGVTGPVGALPVAEEHPCQPVTAYERTKYEAETLALSRRDALDLVVVRPTFTYGPGDPHKVGLFRAVHRQRCVYIAGGSSVNHPVYIDDLLEGLLLAAAHGRRGEVYLLGGSRPVSKRELIETIAAALDVPPPHVSLPRWFAWSAAALMEAVGRLAGFEPILTRGRVMMMADNFGYKIDKAASELGYAPATDLAAGIAATVANYRRAGWL